MVVRQEGRADLGQKAGGERRPQGPDAPAGAIAGLQDCDVVAGPAQLVSAGEAGRAGTHHDHGFGRRRRDEGLVGEHAKILTRPGGPGQASAGRGWNPGAAPRTGMTLLAPPVLGGKIIVPSRPRGSLARVAEKRNLLHQTLEKELSHGPPEPDQPPRRPQVATRWPRQDLLLRRNQPQGPLLGRGRPP